MRIAATPAANETAAARLASDDPVAHQTTASDDPSIATALATTRGVLLAHGAIRQTVTHRGSRFGAAFSR